MPKAISSTGTAAKKAAKENERYMASFDEINQIGSKNSDSADTTDTSGIAPDFSSAGGGIDPKAYQAKIDEITTYASGALLALGVILAFSGVNILLGLGLIALGAAGLAYEVKENWNSMNPKVQTAISNVLTIIGAAGLVIGSVLAFSGINIPLGIGLMAMGAAALVAKSTLPWDGTSQEVKKVTQEILLILGGVLLVIGAVLAFAAPTHMALGIALMAAGAVSLVTAGVLDWDAMKKMLRGPIGAITALVSAALLAVGAGLAFSGANLPLGISLMAAGALGLVAMANLNWDTIQKALKGPIGIVTALVGGALLAIGAVLAFSGANVPLGIGMLVAGGAALVTVAAVNWDTILDHLRDAWKNIKLVEA